MKLIDSLLGKGVAELNYISKIIVLGLVLAAISRSTLLAADEKFVGNEIPQATIHYRVNSPASAAPLLTWSKNPEAVYYQIEFFDDLPEDISNTEISLHHIFFSAQVYVNAYMPDLSTFAADDIGNKAIYWRVRAMDIDGNPMTEFSAPESIYTDKNLAPVDMPIPTVEYNNENGANLLYPVYSWVGNAGSKKFEVEILDELPENPNGTEPSRHRIDVIKADTCEVYDMTARSGSKPFYWRVRGFAEDGVTPVGRYSETRSFVNDPDADWKVAVCGDSISHGGGHISFGPEDWEYSYLTYLDFSAANLAKSGDTSASMVERFDADIVPFHPKYLIIMDGSNSLRGGTAAGDIIEDLKALQEKCLDHNIKPVFLTLPPINPDNIKRAFGEDSAEDWQKQMAVVNDFIRQNLVYIDVAKEFYCSEGVLPTEFALDGLHLDISGKKKMAHAINEAWPYVLQEADEQGKIGPSIIKQRDYVHFLLAKGTMIGKEVGAFFEYLWDQFLT